MLFQLTIFRFITVFVVQSFMVAFYLVIAFKLLKKKKDINRKRLIFSIYYLFCSIGLIINYVYALIHHEVIIRVLYIFTIYIIYAGTSFIAIFAIAMYYEIKGNIKTTKIQFAYIIVLSTLYVVIFFIPNSVVINEETKWYPVVSLGFFIYSTIFINLSLAIFILYSLKTLTIFKRRNENKMIINRWKIYIIGIVETFAFASFAMLVHFLDIKLIRDLWAIVGGILMLTGIYLTWYGIGKKFL